MKPTRPEAGWCIYYQSGQLTLAGILLTSYDPKTLNKTHPAWGRGMYLLLKWSTNSSRDIT